MEGDFLFNEWCKKNNKPNRYDKIESHYNVSMTTAQKDSIWESILEEYDKYTSEEFSIIVESDAEQALLDTELARHGINNYWKGNVIVVPLNRKHLVLDILQGIKCRNVITPSSFGQHLKKK